MKSIKLTVQPSGNRMNNKYRLGMSMADSWAFEKPLRIKLILTDSEIIVNLACGIPPRKAFDLNKRELSEWLVENGFNKYEGGSPPKLIFKIIQAEILTFEFTGQVEW